MLVRDVVCPLQHLRGQGLAIQSDSELPAAMHILRVDEQKPKRPDIDLRMALRSIEESNRKSWIRPFEQHPHTASPRHLYV